MKCAEELTKEFTSVRSHVKKRIEKFKQLGFYGKATFDFKPYMNLEIKASLKTELLFCISTANSSAKSGLLFQKKLEKLFVDKLSAKTIEDLMRESGVRFPKRKSEYAKQALKNFEIIENALNLPDLKARSSLVENVKGFGFKEASHFLRNTGRTDVAILDRHIIGWMIEKEIIEKDANVSLTPKKYVKLEKILRRIAKSIELNLAELDLILWFKKTGKILK